MVNPSSPCKDQQCPVMPGFTYLEAVTHLREKKEWDFYVIGDFLKVPWHSCRNWYSRRPDKPIGNTVAPLCVDAVVPTATWRDTLDFAVTAGEFNDSHKNWQDDATVELKVDRPIMGVFTADWHLGSLATDHKHFRNWINKVLTTDYLYIICCGFDLESRGHFRSIRATMMQGIRPEIQQSMFAGLWEELVDAGKVLATCWDNHTVEQYEKLIGFSPVKALTDRIEKDKGRPVPYFRGVGTLNLRVGDVDYHHLLTHSTHYNSSYNPVHGVAQEIRMRNAHVDIGAAGHIHEPAIQQVYNMCLIRTGTFKTDCDYSMRYFNQGHFAAPTVVYHPDRKEYVPFWNVEQAERYIDGC